MSTTTAMHHLRDFLITLRYRIGAALCTRYGHPTRSIQHEEFIACDRDARGRITDIDGAGVEWFCTRCGQGGSEWF